MQGHSSRTSNAAPMALYPLAAPAAATAGRRLASEFPARSCRRANQLDNAAASCGQHCSVRLPASHPPPRCAMQRIGLAVVLALSMRLAPLAVWWMPGITQQITVFAGEE